LKDGGFKAARCSLTMREDGMNDSKKIPFPPESVLLFLPRDNWISNKAPFGVKLGERCPQRLF
jgi:hypothetical protein